MASGLHSRAGGGRKPEDPSLQVSELRQQDSWDVTLPADKVEVRQDSWDPNPPKYDARSGGTNGTEDEEKADGAGEEEEENSPYPEVRASVPNYDEDLPANTIRAWTLGLILAMVGAGANTLFSIRNPPIFIQSIVAQLAAFFLGRLWAKVLPNRQFKTFGIKWNLNPGPFNVKEHTMVVVMANVSYGTAYATDIILAQVVFYKQNFGIAFQLLLVITTQTAGYGIAGLLREYLVYPAAMIWPINLMGCTVLHAMHQKEDDPDPTVFGGRMSKYRWFAIIMTISFFWYFIPGFLAQFLSMFAFMTWIYPNNPVINQLFGTTTGLGLIPITFDWTQISTWVGNPLTSPWSAIANTIIGIFMFYIIMPIGLHYGDVWYAKYLPILDAATYDNTGSPYNTSRVATSTLTLNEAEYKAYSPLFLSTGFAITYGLSFATIAALVVHVWIHHRHEIVKQFKKSRDGNMDIHMKLMQKYPETPWYWYGAVFAVMIVLSLVMITHWPTEFAWWAFLFSIAFSAVFTLPIGIIQAITNQQLGLNVITEFIMGYMQPGRPLALMLFKTYGYISATQALSFVSDLKL
jgi:OPT family small oligopeptide transporter